MTNDEMLKATSGRDTDDDTDSEWIKFIGGPASGEVHRVIKGTPLYRIHTRRRMCRYHDANTPTDLIPVVHYITYNKVELRDGDEVFSVMFYSELGESLIDHLIRNYRRL